MPAEQNITSSSGATERKGYLAYLLRLWQVDKKGDSAWRASLEDAHSDERRVFSSLEELFDFLRQRVEGVRKEAGDQEN